MGIRRPAGAERRRSVLERIGLRANVLDEGYCGMAGWFGFERGEKAALSRRIGELGVLSAFRAAETEALVLSDGFGCREQIAQDTGRRPMHLAEAIRMAVRST